jgi:hypothetical protein
MLRSRCHQPPSPLVGEVGRGESPARALCYRGATGVDAAGKPANMAA